MRLLPWLLAAVVCLAPWLAASGAPVSLLRPDQLRVVERQLGPVEGLTLYEIDQAIDDLGGTFAAKATIHWTNTTGSPVVELPLLLHPNAAVEHGADVASAGALMVTELRSVDGPGVELELLRPTLVQVRFDRPVAVDERVVFEAVYAGRMRVIDASANDPLAQALASVGAVAETGDGDFGLLAMGDGILVAASAFPMVAPYRDGTFDDTAPPTMGDVAWNHMAAFEVRTIVPGGVTVVTNLVDGVAKGAAPGEPDATIVTSSGAPVREFVVVAGRDLAEQSVKVGKTRVRSVYRPRDERGGMLALDAAVAALKSYEKRFGPYPYVELDVAEATLVGGAGGVEFGGLVLVAGMLYRTSELGDLAGLLEGLGGPPMPEHAPGALDDVLEFTVAHEVAHQYFAGLVGNDSRRFPSLDEPLAQYMAAVAYEDRHGEEAAKRMLESSVKMNYAIYRALGGPDRTVLRDTSTFQSTVEYAGLVYGKAPYAWVALADEMGDDELHEALRTAIDEHRYRITTTEGFLASVEAAAGEGAPVRATLRRWLEETHGDEDLDLADPGAFVLSAILPPDLFAELARTLPALGLSHGDLVVMLLGGELPGGGAAFGGLDPDVLLRALGAPAEAATVP